MAHNDATDVKLVIDGVAIREVGNPVLTNFKKGKEASLITGPGGKVYGFNTQIGNNQVTFEIRVKATSPDRKYIESLVDGQKAVPIEAFVSDNLDKYDTGENIGLGCNKGILLPGEAVVGGPEAEDISYKVVGRDAIERYK